MGCLLYMNLKRVRYYNECYYKDTAEVGQKSSKSYIKQGEIMQDIVLKFFKKYDIKKICDVGCGSGRNALFFHEKVFDVFACDISEKAIVYAQKKNRGPKYFVCDLEHNRLPQNMEGIYAFDVIEHIFDFNKFLGNIYKSLDVWGGLVLSTPNVLSAGNRMRMLFGNSRQFNNMVHIHYFSLQFLRQILEENNFKIIKMMGLTGLSKLGVNLAGSIIAMAKKE